MKGRILLLPALLLSICLVTCHGADKDSSQEELTTLALCLKEKGVVMYGSITCSGCRSQRKAFGDAFRHITEIECNPHIENTQAERCLEKKIRKTPTWVMEPNGQEIKRLVGYQLLEELALFADCEFQGAMSKI